MNATVVGLIVIPSLIFVLGAIFAGVKGSIRFAQYMVRSEEAQESTASSNKEVRDMLAAFMGETREVLKDHGERIRVVEYAIGTPKWRSPGQERSDEQRQR